MVSGGRRYDVYGLGNALVDMVFNVDEAFVQRMKIDKGLMTLIDHAKHDELLSHMVIEKREGGGSAANTLVTLSYLGGKGFYSCKVADDEPGHFYLDALHAAGLETNLHHDALKEGVTGKCLVMVTPDADRTMNTYLGATETFSTDELDEAALTDSSWLYIEGYLVAQKTGQPAAVEAVRMARAHGVKTSLTFSDVNMIQYFRTGMDEIVGDGVDLIFCNEAEACAFAGTDDLAGACERMKKVSAAFAITRGQHGSLIYDGAQFLEVATSVVTAIDTVGAGDTFAGSFLYAITHGYSFAEAGDLANRAASRVVTKYGPRLSHEEIKSIMNEFTRHRKGA